MATYSGLFNNHYADGSVATGTGVPASKVFNNNIYANSLVLQLAKKLKARGNRRYMELIKELTGASVGAAASSTHKQIAAVDQFSLTGGGGSRTINTKTDLSRVTAAGDETVIDGMLDKSFAPTYPTDGSGNGGGGKVGRF